MGDLADRALAAGRKGGLGLAVRHFLHGVPSVELEQFYFQLATMLEAGVAIRSALDTLAGQARGHSRRVFQELARETEGGGELSDAMARRPEVFSTYALAMVRAAETTGRFDTNLSAVARTMERLRILRHKVVSGLIYPLVLLHLAPMILNAPLLFTAPGGVADWFVAVLEFLGPIYLGVIGLYLLLEVFRDRGWFGRVLLALPVVGRVSLKSGLARFSRALAALYDSGVNLPRAVEIAAGLPGNPVLRRSLRAIVPGLAAGHGLAESLARAPHVTPMIRNMVSTGEKSGRLGQALDKAADYYEEETETSLSRLARIVPLFIYLAIVAVIALRILRFYAGYFSQFP